MLTRRGRRGEHGQVVVLFALLVPIILTIGSLVVSVGNWYVLKRHLQTQVDAAALAAGSVANGCSGDATAKLQTRAKMQAEALKYAGDPTRQPTPAPYNQQVEEQTDIRVVLNSSRFWDEGDVTDGSTLDWTMGNPCDTKSIDVKATDYHVPLLFRWIPLVPSVKARALVEFRKVPSTNGLLPIGVPEFDPVKVAALFVDEGIASGNDPASISGRGFLNNIDQATLPPGDPLLGLNAFQGTVPNVNLNNTSNHSVVILASRNPGVSLTYGNGSIQQVCGQDPVQTRCYGGGGLNDGLSFIHVYTTAGSGGANPTTPPIIRDATLSGGCPTDDSRPYYNLDGIDASGNGCTLTLTAHVDFGTATPTDTTTCATLDIGGGSAMTYISGDTWVGTYTFPNAPAGRFLLDLSWTTRRTGTGNCNGGQKWSGTLQDVQGAYVADDKSDPVQYLTLENVTAGLPTTDGNSYPKTSSADVEVTVAFVPALRDTPITNPPIRLRFGTGPSQTQALDCLGSGSGPNGWRGFMVKGCTSWQINQRNGSCATPYPTPPDCIDSENGNFNPQGVENRFASPCTPNNWNGVTYPPDTDPRWVGLFILDEVAFSVPGKRTYPVRRFGGFYVTAGDGMGCPGDYPSSVKPRELWGHFVTYVANNFGETVPGAELCPFTEADLCVPTLVE